jgi:hypothetical protein
MLTVALDLGVTGPADSELVTMKVVGIEDLIVEDAVFPRSHGVASGEAAERARILVGLGREGVGVGFGRASFIVVWRGRLTVRSRSTPLSHDRAGDDGALPRIMSLARIRTLISAWRVRCGFSFDRARLEVPLGRRGKGMDKMQYRNG